MRKLLLLALPGLAAGGCASRHFFQPDARVGAGSAAPLPAGVDSVLATAGRQYNRHGGLYHAFWGRHYRAVWAAPVKAPVLRLATAVPGGLKAGKPGGGYQSISMTLTAAQGREYALRALDKEPSKTLPKVLRHTFVLDVVRDATSAAIPYGALTVPPLAQAAGIPHGRPRLVYLRPDETALGPMSERFQGKLALLEEKYSALASRTPDVAQAIAFVGSEAMLKNVYAQPAYFIDGAAFLRARLLDVWLGDWDRHERQWEWAAFAEPGGRVRYQGIPKDRDQVYFKFDDGLVPWLAARPFIAPQFHTFRPEYGYLPGLVYQAQFIDRRAMAQLTKADFQLMATELQRRLPDSLIARALHRLPPAVYALEGPGLLAALRARRETLPQAAAAYYLTLAREAEAGGTNEPERFVVRRCPDSTTVRVYRVEPAGGKSVGRLLFKRTYYATETRSLSLYGLGGDDIFEVATTGTGKPMRLQLYGGAGHDQLQLQGNAHGLSTYDEAADLAAAGAPRPYQPKKKHRPYDRFNDD